MIVGFGVVFNGCEKEEDPCLNPFDTISGLAEANYDFGSCISTVGLLDNQYIIKTQAEFDELAILNNNTAGCEQATPTPIDFSTYTLLGLYADGACEVIFNRNLEKDDQNNVYIYKVSKVECGACERLEYSMNWVLVRKLQEGYTVQFVVE